MLLVLWHFNLCEVRSPFLLLFSSLEMSASLRQRTSFSWLDAFFPPAALPVMGQSPKLAEECG